MRRINDATARARRAYEEHYGDAEPGGWATPRTRHEDESERSHYSSQRDRQEDRSGFRRGYQGSAEVKEQDQWPERHARSDEQRAGESADYEPDDQERLADAVAFDVAAWLLETEYPGGWICEFEVPEEEPPPTLEKEERHRTRKAS